MWKFRRIGDYYELLDGAETLYLCKRLDSIMIATLEDLCARHNKEIGNAETDLLSLEDAYNNGYEDGMDNAEVERYDTGYEDGYQSGKADGYDLGYRQALHDSMGHDVVE